MKDWYFKMPACSYLRTVEIPKTGNPENETDNKQGS